MPKPVEPQPPSPPIQTQLAAVIRIATGEEAPQPQALPAYQAQSLSSTKEKTLNKEAPAADVSPVTATKITRGAGGDVPPADPSGASQERRENPDEAPPAGASDAPAAASQLTEGPESTIDERPSGRTEFSMPPNVAGTAHQNTVDTGGRAPTLQRTAYPASAREAGHLTPNPDAGRAAGKAERIAIRVEGAQEGPVEIHLQERRGEVHMSLRAAAPEMVERIRESLPQLSERLQAEGFEAEAWRPDAAVRANPGTNEPASPDPHRDGRGRHEQDSESRQSGGGSPQGGESFAELFETEGEQE
jgi:hypothetical protein